MKITKNIIHGSKLIKAGEYAAGQLTQDEIKVLDGLGVIEKSEKAKQGAKGQDVKEDKTEEVSIDVSAIIQSIKGMDLETEIDILRKELPATLTPEDRKAISLAIEEQIDEIRGKEKKVKGK